MLVGNRADCGLFVHFVFSYIIYLLNVSLGWIFFFALLPSLGEERFVYIVRIHGLHRLQMLSFL